MAMPRTLRIYVTAAGMRPFEKWIGSLNDVKAKAQILVRLDRIRLGLLGD